MFKVTPNPPDTVPTSPHETLDFRRNALLGIAQVIMLGELAVKRALDQLDPPE